MMKAESQMKEERKPLAYCRALTEIPRVSIKKVPCFTAEIRLEKEKKKRKANKTNKYTHTLCEK